MRRINSYVFRVEGLRELVIPEGIEEIDSNAFVGSSMYLDECEVSLPHTLRVIRRRAFGSRDLPNKTLLPSEEELGNRLQWDTWEAETSVMENVGWIGGKERALPNSWTDYESRAHVVEEESALPEILADGDSNEGVRVYSLTGVMVYRGRLSEAVLPRGLYVVGGRLLLVRE